MLKLQKMIKYYRQKCKKLESFIIYELNYSKIKMLEL